MMAEEDDSSIEYITESLNVDDPTLEAFSDVFARFQFPEDEVKVRLKSSVFSGRICYDMPLCVRILNKILSLQKGMSYILTMMHCPKRIPKRKW